MRKLAADRLDHQPANLLVIRTQPGRWLWNDEVFLRCLVEKGCLHTAETLDGAPLLRADNVGAAQVFLRCFGGWVCWTELKKCQVEFTGTLGFQVDPSNLARKEEENEEIDFRTGFQVFVHDLWPCSTTFESSSKMFFQDHEWKRLKTQHFYMNYWQSFFWKRNKYFKRVSRAHADQCASKMMGQVFRNCTGLVSGKEPGCSVKIVLASMMHRRTPQEFPNVPSCDLGGTFWYYPLHDVDSFLPWCWFPFF